MKKFEPEALHQFCRDLLEAEGVDAGCARDVADVLIDADLTGKGTHGVSRLPVYLQRLREGLVSRRNEVRIVREGPSSLVIDAGNTLGATVGKFAMEACIQRAGETGCCFATVRASNHFGAAGYYARMASDRDMIGFVCTNLTGKIAPWGSVEPFLGTNPIAVAAPSGGLPVVLDMTPTTVALGKLILAQKLGQSIPLGWALDKDGNPTTDPARGREGSLLPIGGPKGSGLALVVDILCGVLSGAGYGPHLHDLYTMDAPQGIGHFVGAIDIAHFLEVDRFKETLSAMIAEIKGLRKAEGVREIWIPGERSLRQGERSRREGIELPEPVYEELAALGAARGLSL